MRGSGPMNIEEKATGVWVSGDLELKGVLCFSLGGSQCFITFLINYDLLIYQALSRSVVLEHVCLTGRES